MNSLTKKLSELYKNYKHLLWLTYFLIYMPWFTYLEQTVTSRYHVIHTFLDDFIPFCEYFIIPYYLWFAYVAWAVIYTALRNVEDYYKLCKVLFTGMTVFLIISTIYPNGHNLRPDYFSRHNICTYLVEKLYASDTSTNLFPSIHVYNSLAVEFFVLNSKDLKNNRIVKFLSGILCISIILATMFLKQHSTFDVITAFLLAAFIYYLVYMRPGKALEKNTTKPSQACKVGSV